MVTDREWSVLRAEIAGDAAAVLDGDGADAFLARLDHSAADLLEPARAVYGGTAVLGPALELVLAAAAARPVELRRLDRRREADPGWFQASTVQGYVAYVDRFAGTLDGVAGRLDHLAELGVTYLHLMPLLAPREGENDGGYAVADHRRVDPRLGTMDDLERLAQRLRARGISLCTDFVVNHTAREHPWAQGWLAGDPAFADFYTAYPDRTAPDAWDATITSVFPDRAPGSFTWVPAALDGAGGWVWTTFWPYQWDLRWGNPAVLLAVLDEVLHLAQRGVEVFRMDAVPFLWKRLGGSGQNEPQAHRLLQLLHALVRLAAPGVLFKAEAIVAPDELVGYLGAHVEAGVVRYRPECELAYHNQLMVLLWSSLATKDGLLARTALRRMVPRPEPTSWVTYTRCHDDIGWAIDDADADAVGLDGWSHRRFLIDFYTGRFPGSWSDGAPFQTDARTGDARISGSLAALCGVGRAEREGDDEALRTAERRLVLLQSVIYAWGGVPLLYSGDELALDNDTGYLDDPARAEDNRWMHRPPMDWDTAAHRHDPGTVAGRIFGWTRALAQTRAATPSLGGGGDTEVLEVEDTRVLAWTRRHPRTGAFVGLAHFGESTASVALADLPGGAALRTVLSADGEPVVRDGRLFLEPLGFVWLQQP